MIWKRDDMAIDQVIGVPTKWLCGPTKSCHL